MRIAKRLVYVLMVAQIFNGCATINEKYFSYKVASYTIDSAKHLIYYDNIISYGNYIFEFKNRINIITNVYGTSESTMSEYYDTIGVYLLDKNKLYYEFDTFALENKVVKIGNLIDKPYGFKFTLPVSTSSSEVSFTSPKEKVINNINCFITQIIVSNKSVNDSMNVEMVLIKDETFNSLYKMNGIKFTDPKYCIVGLHVFYLKEKAGFFQDIESIKPLTEREKNICANMVKKSKLFVVDTIKGIR